MNASLGIFGISPLKFHSLAKRTQASAALDKFEQSYERQKETVATVLESPELSTPTVSGIHEKAADLDHLVGLMKDKREGSTDDISPCQLVP